MIKGCIFDLDGTILDTITTITYYVNVAHRHFGLGEITEEECKYFVGNGARLLIERSTASKGVTDKAQVEEILEYYNKTYDTSPLYLTNTFDGMGEVLRALKSYGLKLAVVSNKPDPTTKSVVEKFYGDIFDAVEGGRDGTPLKPDPTLPLEVAERLGLSGCEVAFIGDTKMDILTGVNMGAPLKIGCLWGFRKKEELVDAGADVVVSHPCEILEEIRECINA